MNLGRRESYNESLNESKMNKIIRFWKVFLQYLFQINSFFLYFLNLSFVRSKNAEHNLRLQTCQTTRSEVSFKVAFLN